MKRFAFTLSVLFWFVASACGSDGSGGGGASAGGGAGGGGGSGTTCMDGYPKIDSPCAIEGEKCVGLASGYPCNDIFLCQNGLWFPAQSKTNCPKDAGIDAPEDAATDVTSEAADDAAAGD